MHQLRSSSIHFKSHLCFSEKHALKTEIWTSFHISHFGSFRTIQKLDESAVFSPHNKLQLSRSNIHRPLKQLRLRHIISKQPIQHWVLTDRLTELTMVPLDLLQYSGTPRHPTSRKLLCGKGTAVIRSSLCWSAVLLCVNNIGFCIFRECRSSTQSQ